MFFKIRQVKLKTIITHNRKFREKSYMHFPESMEGMETRFTQIFREEISKTAIDGVSSSFDRVSSPPPSHSGVERVRTLNGSRHFKSICLHNFAEERTGIHTHARACVCAYAQGMDGCKKVVARIRLRCICQPRNIFVNLSESAELEYFTVI